MLKSRVAGAIKFVAEDNERVLNTDLGANMACDEFVVAGENLQLHAVALHSHKRGSGIGSRLICESKIARKDQRRLVLDRVGGPGVHSAIGDSEDAKALGAQVVERFPATMARIRIERNLLVLVLDRVGGPGVHSAIGDSEDAKALGAQVVERFPATMARIRIERNLLVLV